MPLIFLLLGFIFMWSLVSSLKGEGKYYKFIASLMFGLMYLNYMYIVSS